jgi:arginine:agmatine antiporter
MFFVTRHPRSRALRIGPYMPIAVVAFAFSLWTIYGAGAEAGLWELLLILFGLPVYVYLRGRLAGPPPAGASRP